jgi:Arc/MetJ family transcription regulator
MHRQPPQPARAPIVHATTIARRDAHFKYGLIYGNITRIFFRMKTTIDLDERRLLNVMKLKGFKTRKQAIDYALAEAERIAKVDAMLREKWSARECEELIDPGYDYKKLRARNRPL